MYKINKNTLQYSCIMSIENARFFVYNISKDKEGKQNIQRSIMITLMLVPQSINFIYK